MAVQGCPPELMGLGPINASKKAGDYLNSQKDLQKEIVSEIGRDIKLEIDQNAEKLIKILP